MAPPKDIARSYPKRGLTADVGFRSEPKFCGDGSTDFDGSADKVTAAHYNPSGDYLTTTAWVNADTLRNQGLIHNGNLGRNSFLFYMLSSGVLRFYWNDTTGDAAIEHQTALIADQWYHLAAVMDMSDPADHQVTWYINGIAATGTRITSTWVGDGTYQFGNQYASAGWFDGKIANCRIYDAALTQDQIRELYNNPGLDFPSGLTASNLRRHYKLETDFNDSGADSENATASGSPSFTVDRPQLPRGLDLARGAAQARVYTGRAVDFDGSTDFLDMGTGVDRNYTTRSDRASFSCWFNTDQTSATAFIYQNRFQVGVTDRPECETQLFTHPSLGVTFDGEGASILIPLTALNVGQWHHFVGIADDADGPVKAYLDGVLYDTTSIPQAGANGSTFTIGARNNTPIQVFNGRISSFKIFNVELTQAQVRELYHNPEMVIPTGVSASNLRRHYPLCAYNDTGGMGGRYETDQGVEGVNGEYGGSPVMDFAQPVPCPQLGLQQSATRVYFENNTTRADATLGSAPGTACTMSAWVMVEDTSSYQYIFTQGTTFVSNAWFGIAKLNTNNKLYALQSSAIKAESSLQLSDYGEWNHVVVMTKSTAPYIRWFINGVEDTSITDSGMVAYNLTSTNVSIGSNPVFANNMQGFANDCAIWDVELSDPEVAALYNSGVQGMDVSTVQSSNLKGWWKCDDLTSFKDYSGNGVNATLTGSVNAASFPENASGSTIVGDFSMKRKGVSVLNCFNDPPLEGVRTVIPSGAGLAPSLTDGHTVSCWYRNQKQDTTSANNGTLVHFGVVSGADQYILETLNGNSFRCIYGGISLSATGTISDNEWHHYAMVLDVTTSPHPTVRAYLDGVAAGTASTTIGTTFPEGETLIGWMGTSRDNFNYGLKGPLACPRIYAFQLSENEIKQIYNSDLRLIKGLANE